MTRLRLGILVVASTLAVPAVIDAQATRGRGAVAPASDPAQTPQWLTATPGDYTLVFFNADQDARAAMTGPLVTGAPYSGRGVTVYTATLSDGTHIKRESSFTIARDSAGRLRREQDDSVWITDPVAQVTYVLKPSDHTARQLPLGAFGFFGFAPLATAGTTGAGGTRGGRGAGAVPADPAPAISRKTFDPVSATTYVYAPASGLKFARRPLGPPESLGARVIEGVNATGTRTSTTIAAGAIGNDRAIVVSDERWYSDELKIVIASDSKDPRSGDTTFRMMDLKRTEPDHSLFVVPAGYRIDRQPGGGK